MKKIQILMLGLLFFGSVAHGQYSETFDVPNKGILSGPCGGSVGTTCLSNDFAGVNWTIEGNLSGIDSEPFATTGAGVLEVNDIDEEACWVSPVLDITGASASFSVDLTWLGYDEDTGAGSDYIDIEYNVDGGGWTQLGNQEGGGARTIEYTSGGGTNNPSYPNADSYGMSGLMGSTLQIRVCIDHNSGTSETTTLDNVTATGADVPGSGPTCDIAITGITVGGQDCPATDDGSLTITATTTNGPILYQIAGPVNQSNATGVFTNLPTGTYTITVDDGSFTAGTCTDTDTRTINAGVDNTDPTASNPAPLTFDCPADIPAPDVNVVTDENDGCTIPCTTDPWINEFHYDNLGADADEFVEVAGPAGIDLSNYTIYTYDGSDRMVDQVRALSGLIDNESNGFGAVVEYITNLQNSTEGIALVRNPSTVIEFLSYEGSFIALDGPAVGLTSTDVGVSEPGNQATNESLSRIGTGNIGTEFTWADQLETPGTLNGNQTMVPCPENAPVVTHFGDTNNGGAGTVSNPYIVTRTYRVTDGAGNFIDVTQTLTANNCGPANDDCAGAIALNCSDTYNGAFDGATNTDTPTECSAPTQEAGVWFSFTGNGDVVGVATTVPVAYNARLNVYSGSCGSLTCVTGDENATGTNGSVTFCSAPGVTYYIFVGTDATGPTGTYSVSISCSNNPPPSITCPANITTNNDATVCGAAVNFTVNASDNCGPPTLSEANGYASGDVFPVGTTTLNWTATDVGGATASCSFDITVNDTEGPTIDCSNLTPSVTRNTRTGFCDYVVQGNEFAPAGFSDNCSAGLSIEADYTLADNLDGAIFPEGTTAVTWTATDGAGMTASCTFNVIIEDNEAPNAICQNITVQLNNIGGATISASDINNGSNDACGIASLSASPTSFNCGAEGNNTVTLTVTDVNGNSNTCTSTVTVEDNVAPTANCQNVTVQLDNNGDGTLSANDVDNNSFDACGIGNLAVSPNTFDCDDVGANTVTLTVTDINGNSSTCTATATVEDNIAPVVVCQDVTVQLDPVTGTTPASPFATGALVSRSDNCALVGGVSSNGPNPITCAQVGSYNQTTFVSDVNGNVTPCTVEITVQDITAPNAVCQNITVQLDASGNATISGSDIDGGSTDACGIASLSANPSAFDCNDLGINSSTLTVTDVNGNSNTCTASINVQDNAAPTAVCQDFTLNLDNAGTTTLDPADIDGGSSTACGTYSLSVSPNGFDCDDLAGGPYTVTLTVTDDSNSQTDNCTASITVDDPDSYCCDPPAAVCQDFTVQLDASGNGSITASDVDGGSTADCGLQSLTATPTTFDCSNVGNNTVTLTITDVKNQSANCTAIVTVEDNVPPTALCQNVTVQLDANGNASTSAAAINNGSNDACGIASISASPTTFDCDDRGANTVTLTVTDNNGNSNTCTATVTVEDNIAPTALCQNTTVQLDASGNGSIVPADVDGGSTDNCTFILTSLDNNAFDCSNVGTNTVVLTISDFSGNSNTCNATVTVEDNVAPIALCQNVTVQLDNNGDGSITAADVDNGSDDACGIASLAVAPNAFDCDDVGPNTVTLTVTDNNGNSNTCTATATVEDNVPPTITECEGNFAVFNGQEEILSASVIDFAATDACGLASTTYSPEYISCEDLGNNVPVTIVVTDNNGNPSTCIAVVKTDGLPCGFMDFEDDGIDCIDGNDVSYDVPSETFTVESDGCSTTNFAQDDAAYVKAELCGDGEIIAHITSLNPLGQGWAGITMRESEAPGAKKVELLVNLGNIIRRAVRTTTNGYAYPAQFFRPGATWLKLVRSGNFFIGYASMDGITWQNVLFASIPMNSCIQAGLMVTNFNNTSVVTATFDNVEVNEFGGGMNLQIPDAVGQTPDAYQESVLDFSIFPNPVSNELQVDLSTMAGKAAEINIYNQMGQKVLNSRIEEAGYLPERLDMASMPSGVYLVEVICGEYRQMKKLMKADQ